MTSAGRNFELLNASGRGRGPADIDDDVEPTKRIIEPGKLGTSEVKERGELQTVAFAPGKLSSADSSRPGMSPADALRYCETMLGARAQVHRWAESDDADLEDDGALGSAFAFITESRSGAALPEALAARLGKDLGADLSRVRIHTDARAAQAAAALRAKAFTLGEDIFFAAGAYDPASDAGVELIAHEVAHVAQQQRGTAGSGRRVSRRNDAHELEAEAFARRFAGSKAARFDSTDPATLVDYARREGARTKLPFLAELEDHFETSFDFVQTYTGKAAETACQALSAAAFAIHDIIVLADPSPKRELLLHELTHIMQMGRSRAPGAFAPGSLRVSDPHGPAEREARQGTGHRAAAPTNEIHRAGPDDAGGDELKARDKRIEYFITTFKPGNLTKYPEKKLDDKGAQIDFYRWTNPDDGDARYLNASKDPWQFANYKATLDTSTELGGKANNTYSKDIVKLTGELAENHRVSRVGDGAMTYVFTVDGKYARVITDRADTVRKAADPFKQFTEGYFPAVVALQKKGRLKGFTVTYNGKAVSAASCSYTTPEADQYRHTLEDKLAAEYAELKNTSWDVFYDEVMGGKDGAGVFAPQYNGVQGNIFEQLVLKTVGKPLDAKRPVFRAPGILRSPSGLRTGDASYEGKVVKIIVDGKAAAAGIDLDQARDYERITRPNEEIGGYYAGQSKSDVRKTFSAVAYAVPGKDIATKVQGQLARLFPIPSPAMNRFFVAPSPDDLRNFILSFNPTVRLKSDDKTKQSIMFANPPSLLPGVTIDTATLNLDAPGGDKVVSGHLVMGIDLGGAFKADGVKKEIKPGADGLGGAVDNKFDAFKTKLDKLLGPVSVDAKLTDAGVEASIAIKAGAAKIPSFNLDGATLTAKYTGEGALSITGEVGLSHKSGKISGKVKVGWTGGDWSFEGRAVLAAGLVAGLSDVALGVKYAGGKTTIFCTQAVYERKLKAVTLTGSVFDLEYDVDHGAFSGSASIEADLGMFGKAKAEATLENNKIKRAELAYDSPEFKYPAKKQPPTFKGTVAGKVVYEDDKFSGTIKGTANLNVPALKAIAGDAGLGLAVDAHVNADGSYGGTIKTLSPLKFGKYFEVPSVGCTIGDDGAVTGDFAIKIKNIKYLESAEIGCRIDKDGFKVVKADIHAAIGKPGDKMWGGIDVGYDETAGLKLTGTLNVKIKEGMVATGTLTYNSKTNAIDVVLTVDEITLFDFKKKQNLFKFSKQIPLVSFYNIIGIYLDLGLDLDFEFDMKLGLKPTISLDGLSFETWQYTKISAEIDLLGQLRAALVATPKVGLGLFAVSPSLLRGGGGIKVPITGEALLKPTGKLKVGYSPSGAVEGDASIGMQLTFGIKGAVKPYAEASVLDGAWNPSWTGDSLADFEILPPKELFNFTLDLAGDMSKKEPAIPTSPQPPSAAGGARQMPQEKPKTTEAGGGGPGKDATPPTTGPAGGAADDSMFKMASLTGALKGLPGYATISGFMEKAGKVWDKIKGFFGRVMKSFQSFFAAIGDAIEEVLNGFAAEGLGYLPKLIKKIVGDSTWEIIEPIVNAAAGSAEAILGLFETDPPKNVGEFFTWGLKLMQKAFGIGFGSIGALISALHTMMTRLAGMAKKIVTKMVQDGMIGVKRHQYYYWAFGNHYFLAADEYKINLLGTNIYFRETGMLLNPNDVVGAGLFTALETMGVPATNMAVDDQTHDTYRDRWA